MGTKKICSNSEIQEVLLIRSRDLDHRLFWPNIFILNVCEPMLILLMPDMRHASLVELLCYSVNADHRNTE